MNNVKIVLFLLLSFISLMVAIIIIEQSKNNLDGGDLAVFSFINLLVLVIACTIFRGLYLGTDTNKIISLFGVGFSVISSGTIFLFYMISHFDSTLSELIKNTDKDTPQYIINMSENFKLTCSVFIAAVYGGVGSGMMLSAITYNK